jgi:hypothetical protein
MFSPAHVIEPVNDQLTLGHLSSTICAELATGLADAEGIRERYSISEAQWRHMKSSPLFRQMLKEALTKFHGDMNAGKRITLKAEILLEDALPVLHNVVHDSGGAISNKLDAVKQLTVLAGKAGSQVAKGGVSGSGFSINMFINAGTGKAAIPHLVIEAEAEAEAELDD